jgi:hypothetical protein
MTFDHPVDPQPGETFSLRWRLKVDEVSGYQDPAISVTSDAAGPNEFYRASFGFGVDEVHVGFGHAVSIPIVAGVFHEYELRSSDMRSYEFYIDGAFAMAGAFAEVFGPPRVTWGQGADGARSLAEWDYVRFGVSPEPSAFALTLVAVAFARHASSRRSDGVELGFDVGGRHAGRATVVGGGARGA